MQVNKHKPNRPMPRSVAVGASSAILTPQPFPTPNSSTSGTATTNATLVTAAGRGNDRGAQANTAITARRLPKGFLRYGVCPWIAVQCELHILSSLCQLHPTLGTLSFKPGDNNPYDGATSGGTVTQ